jgi:hypothetical protein
MRLPSSTILVAPMRRACMSSGSRLSPGSGQSRYVGAWGRRRAQAIMRAELQVALTRVIEPTGGPGVEVATLEDGLLGAGRSKCAREASLRGRAAQVLNRAARPRCCVMSKWHRRRPPGRHVLPQDHPLVRPVDLLQDRSALVRQPLCVCRGHFHPLRYPLLV